MSITAEQIAQLDEGDIQALHDVPGLTDGDKQLLGAALELKRPKVTTVPPTGDKAVKLQQDIERGTVEPKGRLQMADESVRETLTHPSELAEGAKAVGRQLDATGAAALQSIPFAGAGTEALGDLASTIAPGHREAISKVWPTSGSLERSIESAPSPMAARVAGGSAVPLGAAGKLGEGAAMAGQALMRPATTLYQSMAGQAPGGLRTLAAGAGTGAGLAAGDAAIRRLPGLAGDVARQTPIDPVSEILPGAVMGGLTSAPGALASASQNPDSIVGARSIRYARDRASGAYKTGDLAGLFPGKEGVAQANELGKSRIGTAERQAKMDFEDQMPALEQPLRTGERRAMEALDADLADTRKTAELRKVTEAAPIEQRLRGKLQQQRSNDAKTGSADAYSAAIDKAETQLGLDGQPKKFPSKGLMESIRGIVGPHARQDTEGSVAKSAPRPTGLLDAQGKPLTEETEGAPGSGEVHTSFGKALQAIEAAANHYLREDSTIRDYRNFLKAVKTQAESGTAEKTFPFKEVVGAVREHLASLDPELAAATARYRESTTGQSRTQQIVYSKYDPHALGKDTVQGKMDVPEVEDGSFQPKALTPGEEEVGRRNLIELSSRNAGDARIPHREELIANGYGDEINDMRARLDEVDNMTHSTEQKHADAVAQVEADVSRQVLKLKRKIRGQLEEPVNEARTAADELNLSKMSQEASRFPGLSKLVHPMLIGSLGLTSHSATHGASLVGLSANSVAGTIAQPFASRAAYYSPDPATAQANIPGLMGMVSAVDAARERIKRDAHDAAKELVGLARSQWDRIGAKKKPTEEEKK